MSKNTELVQKLETALNDYLKSQIIDLNVNYTDGKVYLTGFVDCLTDKLQASKIVQNYVPNIRFENNITISMNGNISDKQLQEQTEDNLRHCQYAHRLKNVGVKVEGGSATLIGNVRNLSDEIKTLEVARQTIGLKDVVSNLNIETTNGIYSDEIIGNTVVEALSHSDLARHSIIPNVKKGIVTLEGTVDHPYEVEMAGDLIADIDGVSKIKNHIRNREDDKDNPN